MVGWLAGGMLTVSAALALIRLVRGPSTLDRVVAVDVLVAIALCGLGVEAALNRHGTTLPILIALSLVGFVGAVSVARVVARGPDRATGRTTEAPNGTSPGDDGQPST